MNTNNTFTDTHIPSVNYHNDDFNLTNANGFIANSHDNITNGINNSGLSNEAIINTLQSK